MIKIIRSIKGILSYNGGYIEMLPKYLFNIPIEKIAQIFYNVFRQFFACKIM